MNLPSVVEELYKALILLAVLAWKFRQKVLNALTVIIAVSLVCGIWFAERTPILFFTGSTGSISGAMAKQIADRISNTQDPSGLDYVIATEHVSDLNTIRERMAVELNRHPLGIVEDNQSAEEKGIRALLPLQWEYLFVLCRSKYLKERAEPAGKPFATKLADLIDDFDRPRMNGRMLLWPEGTLSHKLGTMALKKFGDPKIQHYAKGITTWREMRTAFKNDELDLAFVCTSLGSDYIREIAEDGDRSVVLLSLGNISEGIQAQENSQVYAAELPASFGHAEITDSREPQFCPYKLKTLATRRVLACSEKLPVADAYLLADAAHDALTESGYSTDLEGTEPPVGCKKDVGVRMLPHPGLTLLRQHKQPFVWRDPSTWNGWVQAGIGILFGLLLLDGLRLVTMNLNDAVKRTAGAPSEEPIVVVPVRATASADYQSLDQKLLDYENMIDELTHQEIASDLAVWDERLRDLRKTIHRSPGLTETERESLWQRYRRVTFEVETAPHWANNMRKHVKS